MQVCLITPDPIKNTNISGGILTWTDIVLNEDKDDEINIVDSSTGFSTDIKSKLKRIIVGLKTTKKIISNLKKTLSKNAIDVVHVNSSASFALFKDKKIFKICKKHNCKIIYHLHFGRIPSLYNKKNWEWKQLNRNFEYCDKIILMDKKSFNVFKNDKKFIYIPNPVKIPNIHSKRENKQIVYVGHIIKAKGVFELINAWSNIYNFHSDYTLNFVGALDDSIKDEFYNKINNIKNIKYLGTKKHEEVINLLGNASILALPSYTEGFPNVVLEAMASGVCVIATNVGGIPDAIDEKSGILIPPKDVKSLEEGLLYLINNKNILDEMAETGYKKALNEFSSEIVCKQYQEVWNEVIENKGD